MRIAICDDEEKFRVSEKQLIDRLCGSMDVIVDAFADGRKLIERFEKAPYEVVFLDIEMPEMDGITLAKKLREMDGNVYLVFLTGHVEYAVEGYEVNALRYLTKPVKEEKLKEVLRFVMEKNTKKKQFAIRTDGEDFFFGLNELIYFEAQNQYVKVYTTKGEYLVRANISDYEKQLSKDGFFRIHRGYLVSLSKVKKMGTGEVLMDTKDGEVSLPVSRSNIKPLKEALYAFVEDEAF